nr:reverse transcriptase domain-containing protein [Tanacetum cinerariifolium]GFA58176.1 reverse transcriptase domain-containing protein [Tanacetum cinerariifolium]
MAPKRTSTSAAPSMNQAAIQQLIDNRVASALEAQATNMANTDNTNRNLEPRETSGIHRFQKFSVIFCNKIVADSVAAALEAQAATMENTDNTNRNTGQRELLNCTKDCKVKLATGTLTEEALPWWNSFAQPIGIEEAYKIPWSEFKKLLIQKYCPRTEVKKMEDEFYNLTVKGNDLNTYVRRF